MERLQELYELVQNRQKLRPVNSYTTELFEVGKPRIAQKVGEEAVEVVVASLAGKPEEIISETADLMYHLTVLMVESGITWEQVLSELDSRQNGTK